MRFYLLEQGHKKGESVLYFLLDAAIVHRNEEDVMSFTHYADTRAEQFRENAERRIAMTDHLMMVVFDFTGGPQAQPDAPHAHPHEQTSCVVLGEVNFFLGDECRHLVPGDMVAIPGGVPHAIQLLTEHVRLVDSFTPIREDFLV
ncbi:MAG: cupin domain-containing protein [Anaerolineae bacterium]|nr:cupin domain-containing protein [Anaerolineae bacterium]